MLSGPVSRAEGRTTEAKRQSVPNKTSAAVTEESAGETFPAAQCDKTYQPTVFTGQDQIKVLLCIYLMTISSYHLLVYLFFFPRLSYL